MMFKRFLLILALMFCTTSATVAQVPRDGLVKPARVNSPFRANEVGVLIVMGQSNAEGWGQWLPDASRVGVSLPNVYGLSRSGAGNLGAIGNAVTWEKYSIKNFNLGDNYDSISGKGYGSYHLVGEFSQMWQDYVKSYPGELPDLYVIHIAWGAQGFVHSDAPYNYWSPEANTLFPLAKRVISQGMASIIQKGKTPRVIGLHWNQWETEASKRTFKNAMEAEAGFRGYLAHFRSLFSGVAPPTYLYQPRAEIYDRTYTEYIKSAFAFMSAKGNPDNYHLIDAASSPFFNPAVRRNFGIFAPTDNVHYTGPVQQWFAQQQWSNLFDKGILGAPFTVNNPSWTFNAAGDFDADGKLDLLFKRSFANTYSLLSVKDSVYKKTSGIVQQPLYGWKVDKVADFDGDGKTDLLFRLEGTNKYVMWFMDGLKPKKTSSVIKQPPANWFVTQAADFDGDGQTDLLLSAPGNSVNMIWYMNGLTHKSTGLVQSIPYGWSIALVADFDGDRKPDLLLNQDGTNQYMVWYLDGLLPKPSSGPVSQLAPGWSVVRAVDFDGDAKTDLLLKHEGTNDHVIWFMDGLQPKTTSGPVAKTNADWFVIEAKDFDGDGKADLLFKRNKSENYQIWYMDGLKIKSTTSDLTHPMLFN